MEYMLLLYIDEAGWPKLSKAEQEQGMAAYVAYTEALNKAGVMRGGGRLQPTSTATTVRHSGGRRKVIDGPYAETKEQFGGYYIIEAPDLDAAIEWAAKCPASNHGVIEVRPLWA